jgi:hypothetical protein
MVLKQKKYTPQEYIQIGMAFFLVGMFVSQMADDRLVGAFVVNLLSDKFSAGALQGFADGLSIPILCASIYFNVRGLVMLRS